MEDKGIPGSQTPRELEPMDPPMAALEASATEHKRAEEILYYSLVENLPVHVLRKDMEGRFVFANRSFCELVGRPFAEIVGRTDFDFFPRPWRANSGKTTTA